MDRRVVWFILNIFSFTTVYADPNDNPQVEALIALKNSLHDPTNVLNSWVDTKICQWFHITCDTNGGVVRIDLGNAGLSGTLVPELGNLTTLQQLEMYENQISGKIPPELGKLSNLVVMDLYDNQLTGPIPPELGNLNVKILQSLRLDSNNLCGLIPVVALAKIDPWGKVINITNNPHLCTAYTDPPCPQPCP